MTRTCSIWAWGWSWGWSGVHDRPRRWELSLILYLLLAREEAAHQSACIRFSPKHVSCSVQKGEGGMGRLSRDAHRSCYLFESR
jgi:hypothetical protein